jgi:hypothetical protein
VRRPPSPSEAFEQRTGFKLTPVEKAIMDECPPGEWSKNVPKRGCMKDDECGDGYCSQGECYSIFTCNNRYGLRCESDDHCDDIPRSRCTDGRCRSVPRSEMYERRTGLALSPLDKAVIDACPARAWSRNVPRRRCTTDGQCGEGFCDRGRCAARWTCQLDYGRPCKGSDGCSVYPCIDGRCRSCTSESECDWKRGRPGESDVKCQDDYVFVPGARACIGVVTGFPSGVPSMQRVPEEDAGAPNPPR